MPSSHHAESRNNVDAISNSIKIDSNTSKSEVPHRHLPQQSRDRAQNDYPQSPPPRKQFILGRAWKKIGITPQVFMIMVKPSISAVIAMAIYQKHSVAVNYLNLGYLIIIISIITVPILPRGKYLMNLFLCLVSSIPSARRPHILVSFKTCFSYVLSLIRNFQFSS